MCLEMKRVLLVQLPIPQSNFGRQTGNTPLAAAWLNRAAADLDGVAVSILPESIVSYLGDAALLDRILAREPDVVGFTVYSWNLDRCLYLAHRLKAQQPIRIVFGGPEITFDNPRLEETAVDFLVCGEGESVFRELLSDPKFWSRRSAVGTDDGFFTSSPSPYLSGLLEPQLGNTLLLETQRGCPFRCGYCYYNKARRRLAVAPESILLEAVDWVLHHGIGEVYLLDPCLTARPRLKGLLEKLAACNRARRIGFVSEIRAEAVDEDLADLFQAAGFLWFEIGLQSTNPAALKIMNRPTDLARFIAGARRLKQRDILPRIDLILGLPGDDLPGFQRSVDFVVEHDLADDVQVFPLSVLPGTDFRKRSRELGLHFDPAPPYPVIQTPAFSREEMLLAVDYAESRLDVALYPFPDPDIAWRRAGGRSASDLQVRIGEQKTWTKLYLDGPRSQDAWQQIAQNLAHPYQLFVDPRFGDHDALGAILETLSGANPFTPFEVVFLEPGVLPDSRRLLASTRLQRPHFLDVEQRFLFPKPGNRAVIFSLVSANLQVRFRGEMERQLFWWKHSRLPDKKALKALLELDGVLIDAPLPEAELERWQDRLAPLVDDLPHIVFPDLALQRRWLQKLGTALVCLQ
ncbi:MAG TPA: B12-binding domain-containing radical SAM protein [Desulfobacterales bacterium]